MVARTMFKNAATITSLVAGVVFTGAVRAHAQQWEQIAQDDGITTWQREVPGTSLVEFRGRATIKGPIQRLFAILHDQENKTKWLASCAANFAVEHKSIYRVFVYNRTASPAFFISDRDVVMDVTGEFDASKKMVRIEFANADHAKLPPQHGVVRMPKLKGHWYLTARSPDLTDVEYQVQADPGGSIPKWIVNWASRGLPRRSLTALRGQLPNPEYEKELAFVEGAYDWTGFEFNGQAVEKNTQGAAPPSAESPVSAGESRQAQGG